MVSQWFLGGLCGSPGHPVETPGHPFQIRVIRREPQGRIQRSFFPVEEPSSETLLGNIDFRQVFQCLLAIGFIPEDSEVDSGVNYGVGFKNVDFPERFFKVLVPNKALFCRGF